MRARLVPFVLFFLLACSSEDETAESPEEPSPGVSGKGGKGGKGGSAGAAAGQGGISGNSGQGGQGAGQGGAGQAGASAGQGAASGQGGASAGGAGVGGAGQGGAGQGGAGQGGAGQAGQAGAGGGCVGLQCQQQACPGGGATRIKGVVYAPTKVDPEPLPNVTVYIPNGKVEPFAPGVACETCQTPLSGSPLVTTVSSFDGSFTLENAPVGKDIPLVIQSGRWRREVKLASVEACVDNQAPAELTRMPRNQGEGSIPLMAVQTGFQDAVECTLAKMLDLSELTAPGGGGRVHLFHGSGKNTDPPLPEASTLWNAFGTLKAYDLLLFPCPATDVEFPIPSSAAADLKAYTSAGGRVYLTHTGGTWLTDASAFGSLVTLDGHPDPPPPLLSKIDTSFPKGMTFAQWLDHNKITQNFGELSITAAQWYGSKVDPPLQRWIYSESPTTIQHFTFNTPIESPPGEQCGRVLFSNFHVADSGNGGLFPDTCKTGALTPNEKIILYMLFDVAACVSQDKP